MNRLEFNMHVGIHNLSLVNKAKKIINDFIRDGGIIYASNPDGTHLELQEGVDLITVDGLGIAKEKESGLGGK
jgi:hypothetical protein